MIQTHMNNNKETITHSIFIGYINTGHAYTNEYWCKLFDRKKTEIGVTILFPEEKFQIGMNVWKCIVLASLALLFHV